MFFQTATPADQEMQPIKRTGVRKKLVRVFLMQIALISVATFAGVFASAKIVENVLVKKALESEAEHYWQIRQTDSSFPAPNTFNLTGYLAEIGQYDRLPAVLRNLEPGYGRVELDNDNPITYVSDKDGERLYLLFSGSQVSKLALYFGVVPLTIVLLIVYLISWLAYRQSSRAISPLVKLADIMAKVDINAIQSNSLDLSDIRASADGDAVVLIDAIEEFTNRTSEFIARERQFARDASHELRTPLAIVKGSFDLLNKNQNLPEQDKKAISRVKRTVENMEALLETLLMLSREQHTGIEQEAIIVNDLLAEQIAQIKTVYKNHKAQLKIKQQALLEINASEKVLAMLFGNLIRNAFNYTNEGEIIISVLKDKRVVIKDSGTGMDEEQLKHAFRPFYRANTASDGHGVGLSIVAHLCERFAWQIDAESKVGEGTSVSITLPNAKIIGTA